MKFWNYIFSLLLLILFGLIIAISQIPDDKLHIVACNVGQGDAILVYYKNIQILTDGGPDKSVMNCLGKYIPFWDRTIELVVSTHPDADHSTGLISVIKNYKVDKLLINSIDPSTQVYGVLKDVLKSEATTIINPIEGLSLGTNLIHLDILGPSDLLLNNLTVNNEGDKLSKYKATDNSNLYSIVYKLSFKKFSALMLGDIPPEVSDMLASSQGLSGVEWIKLPHHGSKNGLTENLLKSIVPDGNLPQQVVGIISVGNNPWGLPSKEIIEILTQNNVIVKRTDEVGDIRVATNGNGYLFE